MENIGVVGIGNTLRGDDGIGIILLNCLKNLDLPNNVQLIDAGIAGMNLIHMIEPFEIVIFLDAVNFEGKPGDFNFFKPEQVKTKKINESNFTTHESNVLNIIEIFKRLNKNKKINFFIFGIQPSEISYGSGLSEDLQKVVEKLCKEIQKKIQEVVKK